MIEKPKPDCRRPFLISLLQLAAFSLALPVAPIFSSYADDVQEFGAHVTEWWGIEYSRLAAQIADRENAEKYGYYDHAPTEHAKLLNSDQAPADIVIRRTEALLRELESAQGAGRQYDALKTQLGAAKTLRSSNEKAAYYDACAIRRKVTFSNTLLDFEKIVLTYASGFNGIIMAAGFNGNREDQDKIELQDGQEHIGFYTLSDFKTPAPRLEPLFKGRVIQNGAHQGKALSDIAGWYQYWFDLDWDAKSIVFAKHVGPKGLAVFRADLEGDGLVQLTESSKNIIGANTHNYEPCFTPSGRIVFVSTLRGLVARCGQEFCGTLYSMKADGSDLYPISWHETSDFNPSIDINGQLVYTRWDYVDRDYNAAHHIWISNPDGSDPRAPHGNYPLPHTTVDTVQWWSRKWDDNRHLRPFTEVQIRAIPNAPSKYVAIAGSHHHGTPGAPIVIDISKEDDNKMSQVSVLDPSSRLVKDETSFILPNQRYLTPWPLSDKFFLITSYYPTIHFPYDKDERKKVKEKAGLANLGKLDESQRWDFHSELLVMDVFGNTELLFSARDRNWFHSYVGARPLSSRTKPAQVTARTWQGERYGAPDHYRATIGVTNVYNADNPFPENTKIKKLRIVYILPRICWFRNEHKHEMGYSYTGQPRAILGTVPVEEDGSAYFEAPVDREIYFQALDENDMAVVSMRSGTYVHPGEQLQCAGCHENRWTSLPLTTPPTAFKRTPSKITPAIEDACPISFARLVEPTLKNKCIPCHQSERKGPQSAEYDSLRQYAFFFHAGGGGDAREAMAGGFRSIPGLFGARASKMGKALLKTHRDRITQEEFDRMVLWLDGNSMRYSYYYEWDKQDQGAKIWGMMEVDSIEILGVENDRPLAGQTGIAALEASLNASVSAIRVGIRGKRLFVFSGAELIKGWVRLYDMHGRAVCKANGATLNGLRLDNFSPGFYILKAQNLTQCITIP